MLKEFYDCGRELIEQDPDVFEIDRKVRYLVPLAEHRNFHEDVSRSLILEMNTFQAQRLETLFSKRHIWDLF